jgi:hypothetical protein
MTLRIRLNVPLNVFLNSEDESLLHPSLSFSHESLSIRVTLRGGEPLLLSSSDEPHYRSISQCQIEILDPAENLRMPLESQNHQELVSALMPVVNRTLAAIRNFGWVTTAREYKPEDDPEALLRTWDARYRTQGHWKAIAPEPEKASYYDALGLSALGENVERGSLSVSRWQDIEQALIEDLKPKPEQEFLTNSLQHLREGNLRLALIEATVCLEIVLSQTIVLHLKVRRFFTKKKAGDVLNSVGLTSKVGLLVDSIFSHNERSGIRQDKVLQAINWRNTIIHRTGHIPESVPTEEVRDCIYEMLTLSLRLGEKREKLQAEPELSEISRAIASQFDCPTPEIEKLKYHKMSATLTFYVGGLRPIIAPSIPEKKIPDRAGLEQIVNELASKLKNRDPRFDPAKHLSVVFKHGFGTVFATFENGRWTYATGDVNSPAIP